MDGTPVSSSVFARRHACSSVVTRWFPSVYSYIINRCVTEGRHYVASGKYRVSSTAKSYNSSGTLLETESFVPVIQARFRCRASWRMAGGNSLISGQIDKCLKKKLKKCI
jgi:hypothetical protein